MDYEAIAKNHAKLLAKRRADMKRIVRAAYARGDTVPYTLGELLDMKLSMKVVCAVIRGQS